LFTLENEGNTKNGLITGTITQPTETEVIFGVTNTNTADWNQYKEVELDKLFKLDNWESLKVGIKFVSYGDNVASACEFGIMTGSELKRIL
jgi:hypothetical protein